MTNRTNRTGTEVVAVWPSRAEMAASDVITWAARAMMLLELFEITAGTPGATPKLYSWLVNQARAEATKGKALKRQVAKAARELVESLESLAVMAKDYW